MELPRIDPVGILRVPEGFTPCRPRSTLVRFAAALVLLVFAVVTVATTVVSLGRYCLTTDAANTTHLPAGRSAHAR